MAKDEKFKCKRCKKVYSWKDVDLWGGGNYMCHTCSTTCEDLVQIQKQLDAEYQNSDSLYKEAVRERLVIAQIPAVAQAKSEYDDLVAQVIALKEVRNAAEEEYKRIEAEEVSKNEVLVELNKRLAESAEVCLRLHHQKYNM